MHNNKADVMAPAREWIYGVAVLIRLVGAAEREMVVVVDDVGNAVGVVGDDAGVDGDAVGTVGDAAGEVG